MKKISILLAASTFIMLPAMLIAVKTEASLIGDTVHLVVDPVGFNDKVETDLFVGAGLELDTTIFGPNFLLQADVAGDTITMSYQNTIPPGGPGMHIDYFGVYDWIWTDLDWLPTVGELIGVSITGGNAPGRVTLLGPDSFLFEQGASDDDTMPTPFSLEWVVTLETTHESVPTPATLPLFGICLTWLVWSRRQSSRDVVTNSPLGAGS